jgi:hypothetical protein
MLDLKAFRISSTVCEPVPPVADNGPMTASQLLTKLTDAGLHVVEEPHWETRGNNWAVNGKPEGVMQHHTGPPDPFPINKLYGPPFFRTKCNMATHPDGTLYLVAYKACNYSSGVGMKSVLTDYVRKSIAPTHNATSWGLKGGNRHFWNLENSHLGDGSAIPVVQLDVIVLATQVVLDHFDLDPEQVISHASWTSRKVDPRWNGWDNRIAITQIRTLVDKEPLPVPPPPADWTEDLIMALPTLAKGDGFTSEGKASTRPDVANAQGLLLANGHKDQNSATPETATDGWFGSGTAQATRNFQSASHLTVDGIIGRDTWTALLGQ